jgi:hypothetical protein
VLNEYEVGDLTKILSREQYIAKVLGSMNSPVSNMVNVLSGTIRNFMNVMQARVDQLKEQGGDTGEVDAGDAQAVTLESAAPEVAAEAAPEAGSAAGTEPTPVEASIDDAPTGDSPDVATSVTEAGPGTGDAPQGDVAAADIEGGTGGDATTESVEG